MCFVSGFPLDWSHNFWEIFAKISQAFYKVHWKCWISTLRNKPFCFHCKTVTAFCKFCFLIILNFQWPFTFQNFRTLAIFYKYSMKKFLKFSHKILKIQKLLQKYGSFQLSKLKECLPKKETWTKNKAQEEKVWFCSFTPPW